MSSLYLYALYYILTVVTTVGYGTHSYQTTRELLFACCLEIIGTLIQAYFVMILATTLTISHYSF